MSTALQVAVAFSLVTVLTISAVTICTLWTCTPTTGACLPSRSGTGACDDHAGVYATLPATGWVEHPTTASSVKAPPPHDVNVDVV
jgi:hypothetical protein